MSILGFHAGDLGLNIHEGAVGSCNQFSHLYVSSQRLKLSRDRCAIYHHSLSNVPEWRLPLVLEATKSWRRENELLYIVFSLNENSRFLFLFFKSHGSNHRQSKLKLVFSDDGKGLRVNIRASLIEFTTQRDEDYVDLPCGWNTYVSLTGAWDQIEARIVNVFFKAGA